ncbi:uncharacterized protein METZ01_LOCUS234064 [marine metagenome]|uniref:DUF3501 domain-containing protein n=1 Tax=marine metagenome TaxID=408172 RepID=A0A382H1S7_9ZZZZ
MKKLELSDLFSLEEYHEKRAKFRATVLAHKRNRQVSVGPSATLYFEDRITMHYQVQEMLRIERIFETEAIAEELMAYNPLIPDGSNLKATLMLEYPESGVRRQQLKQLLGIEDVVYLRVPDLDTVTAIADEDLGRTDMGKTSAVHFMRFELSREICLALKNGETFYLGIGHTHYTYETEVLEIATRASLVADLD